MNIEKARKLKPNDTVYCPADRGEPAFVGRVTLHNKDLETAPENINIHGEPYVWVEIMGPGHKSVWPSNRLG